MNTPLSYIAAAAASALDGTGTFLHERAEQATLSANWEEGPFIVLSGETASVASSNSRVVSAAITLYLGDVRPGKSDDAEAQNAAVARMRVLAARLFAALDASPLTRMDNLRETTMYNVYEAELDGIGIQFTLTVPAGKPCPPVLPLPPEPVGGFPYLFEFALTA